VTAGLGSYLQLLHSAETTLLKSLLAVATGHAAEAEVYAGCHTLAKMSEDHQQRLAPMLGRYEPADPPDRFFPDGSTETRSGPVGLLRDLQDLYLLATLVQTSWTLVYQGAQGARDRELIKLAEECNGQTSRQLSWLNTQLKNAAPQALLAAQ
jgi:hypothetical protein